MNFLAKYIFSCRNLQTYGSKINALANIQVEHSSFFLRKVKRKTLP